MIELAVLIAAIDGGLLTGLLATLLGGGGLGAFLTWRKTSAEAEAVSVATMRGVIEELRAEITRMNIAHQAEIARKEEQIAKLRERIAVLEEKLV